jgi:hypothetical protein
VPTLILREATERTLYELLAQNKLGEASLSAEDRAIVYDPIRYYIPYAVPITLEREMLPEANRMWDVIRTEYYAFRERLPALPEWISWAKFGTGERDFCR